VSETLEPVAPEVEAPAPAAPEPSPAADLRSAIAAAFDEAEKSTAPEGEAPQRDERGRFVGHERETTDVDDHEGGDRDTQTAAPPEAAPPPPHPLEAIAKEYEPYYASAGLGSEQATRMLFQAHKALLTDPVAGIRNLATQYGVDLRQFAPQPRPETPPAQTQAAPSDPALASVQRELAELKQFLSSQQQRAVEAENATVEQTIQAFASDPKHPHFPAVRTAMGALMQAGIAKDLDTAYEMACRAHPEVWKSIQAAEADARSKAEHAAKVKAAADAKLKTGQVRGAVPVPGHTPPPRDRRALIEAAWDGRLN